MSLTLAPPTLSSELATLRSNVVQLRRQVSWLEASAEGRTLSELLLTFLLRGPNGYRDALMETEDGRGGLSRNASPP